MNSSSTSVKVGDFLPGIFESSHERVLFDNLFSLIMACNSFFVKRKDYRKIFFIDLSQEKAVWGAI